MTLILTVFAAIICTVIWYRSEKRTEMKLGLLSLMYWGASLMWTVDAVYGFIDDGAAFFTPPAADVLNDLILGLAVVALGLVIWLAVLLINDPEGIVKKAVFHKK